MRKTTLVIDDDLVAAAQKALGTTGLKATIDRALIEAVAMAARQEALRQLRDLDGLDLADSGVMEGAWR